MFYSTANYRKLSISISFMESKLSYGRYSKFFDVNLQNGLEQVKEIYKLSKYISYSYFIDYSKYGKFIN